MTLIEVGKSETTSLFSYDGPNILSATIIGVHSIKYLRAYCVITTMTDRFGNSLTEIEVSVLDVIRVIVIDES